MSLCQKMKVVQFNWGLMIFFLFSIFFSSIFKISLDPFPSDVDYLDTWRAMESLVNKGLTRSIGVSNFNSEQLKRLVENCKIKPIHNQVRMSISIYLYLCTLKKKKQSNLFNLDWSTSVFESKSIVGDLQRLRHCSDRLLSFGSSKFRGRCSAFLERCQSSGDCSKSR